MVILILSFPKTTSNSRFAKHYFASCHVILKAFYKYKCMLKKLAGMTLVKQIKLTGYFVFESRVFDINTIMIKSVLLNSTPHGNKT